MSNNNLGQVTGSNVGSIAGSLFSIITTMQELNQNYNDISIDTTEMQNSSSQWQREEIGKEAKQNAIVNFVQAGASLASGITDAGVLAGNAINTSSFNTELKNSQTQLDSLNQQEQEMNKAGAFKGVAESSNEPVEPLSPEEQLKKDNINARKEELLNGNITDGKPELQQYTTEAFEASDDSGENNERKTIQNNVADQKKSITKDMQSKYSQIQTVENQNRLYGDMAKQGVIGTVSQYEQGKHGFEASEAKQKQLAGQYDQSAEQTEQQAVLKAMDNNLNYMSSAFQALVQAAAQSA